MLTGNPVFDALGTIAIGVLLGVIAVILDHRDEEPADRRGRHRPVLDRIVGGLEGGDVERVIHIRTQYLGPEELLVAAKIAMAPRTTVEEVARAIDDAEERVREAVPDARMIYLEPDLDRSDHRRRPSPRTPERAPVRAAPDEWRSSAAPSAGSGYRRRWLIWASVSPVPSRDFWYPYRK